MKDNINKIRKMGLASKYLSMGLSTMESFVMTRDMEGANLKCRMGLWKKAIGTKGCSLIEQASSTQIICRKARFRKEFKGLIQDQAKGNILKVLTLQLEISTGSFNNKELFTQGQSKGKLKQTVSMARYMGP